MAGFDVQMEIAIGGDHLGYLTYYVEVDAAGDIELQTPELRDPIPVEHPLYKMFEENALRFWRDEIAECQREARYDRVQYFKELARGK